jgi:iron complex outermembrane receptor protein
MRRNNTLTMAICAACFVAPAAHAETVPGASDGLGEVVVTAQRREQKMQDVPIAVQVITTEMVGKHVADDMAQLDKWIPGLVVSGDSPTQPHYQLRGIGASDFGVGTDPAVGVYVDGVYAARSGASFLAFNDIERIEVLKGPQGTLLGRSSAAGAVSIVTHKPTDVLEGSADLRFGSEGKQRYEGMLNVPLADGMALRFNALSNQADGFLRDAATGQKLNPEKNWAARAAFRWDINPDTKLLVSWNHDAVNQLARVAIGLVPPAAAGTLPPWPADPTGASFLNPITAPIYNDVVGNGETRKFDDFMAQFQKRIGEVDFTSTTDWRQFRTTNREDEDGTNQIATYFDTNNIERNAAWYQEFKLSGKTGRADWVAGVSYSYEHAQQISDTHLYTDGVDTLFLNLCVAGVRPDCPTVYGPTSAGLAEAGIPISLMGLPWNEAMHDDGRFKSLGIFGDVIWHLTDRLNLTTGLRYSRDTKDFTWLAPLRSAPELDAITAVLAGYGVDVYPVPNLIFSDPRDVPGQPPVFQGTPYSASGSWSDVSPRLVLDYKIDPNKMVYTSVAKGFTPGGFDSVQFNGKYDNEDVWNYELGFKTVFPEAHVRFNGAVYYYQYKNKQSLVLTSVPGSAVPEYTVSSSDQKAYGVDLELQWRPVTALTLSLESAYINSTYTKYLSPALLQEGAFGGLTGADLAAYANLAGAPTGEPNWSFAANADYTILLADRGAIDVFVSHSYRGETRCNGESQATRACLPAASFPLGAAQDQTDARIGWRSANGKWGIAAYGSNLFDKRYVTGINGITALVFGTPIASVNAPRRYGVELHAAF